MSKIPTVEVTKDGHGPVVINERDLPAYEERGYVLREPTPEPAPEPAPAEQATNETEGGDAVPTVAGAEGDGPDSGRGDAEQNVEAPASGE